MIEVLSTNEAVNRLMNDEYAGWSYAGATALVEYMEEFEYEIGSPIELDVVGLRCDFSEYESYQEIWNDYGNGTEFIEGEELAIDCNIKQWLEEQTTVIEFDGGVIIQQW